MSNGTSTPPPDLLGKWCQVHTLTSAASNAFAAVNDEQKYSLAAWSDRTVKNDGDASDSKL